LVVKDLAVVSHINNKSENKTDTNEKQMQNKNKATKYQNINETKQKQLEKDIFISRAQKHQSHQKGDIVDAPQESDEREENKNVPKKLPEVPKLSEKVSELLNKMEDVSKSTFLAEFEVLFLRGYVEGN
jgi:hypothetical protein